MTPQQKALQDCIESMLKVARMAEALKRECGMDPESAQAIRNSEYMSISYAAREAITQAKQALEVQAQGEAVVFLCDGTRFKVRQNEGDEAGRIYGLPSELNGRWVALVAADDDCHLKMTHPQASEPAWMPIETAPKDGRKIIVTYSNRNGRKRTVMACWVTDEAAAETDADDVGLEAGWFESIDNWNDYTEVAIHEGEPTHWMPIPAAPAIGGQQP